MKISISAAISFIFITFCCILFISILNFSMTLQKVNDYHYATVHEIESSDFSPYVIAQRQNHDVYQTEIHEKSVIDELRIYEVRTSAAIRIPLLQINTTYVKESIAR